ncbi:MAG TPA: peptide deformylase [Candidatus Saccharimonadales bacterium]|nr:peptide deformylase [Candidatus Saccharimonadales bacterium]
MLLDVAQVGKSTLRDTAKKVTVSNIKAGKTQQLIDLMIATLRAKPGVGLAAPQVGEPLRIIIVEDKKQYQDNVPKELLAYQKRKPVKLHAIVNPEIEIIDAAKEHLFEGCLSIAGYRAVVPRAKTIRVSGLDRNGKPIIQYEVDHLNGKLYIDIMHPKSFISEKSFSDNWAKATPEKLSSYIKGTCN